MLGESKFKILQTIPEPYKPKTIFCSYPFDLTLIIDDIESQFEYPLIAKPDIGERGWGVAKICSTKELLHYLSETNVNIIIQEYISLPLELGVFYYRHPDAEKGTVSSIVHKEMLSVTGDGVSTVNELITRLPRAWLQHERIRHKLKEEVHQVLPEGKKLELEPIGNHSRGTMFLNGNKHITESLTNSIDTVSQKIPSFYFGRFDLRCANYPSLEAGSFKIMELNGAGAEPAHIYEPGTSIFAAYKAIFHHLSILQKISAANHRKGAHYMSLSDGFKEWQKLSKYNKSKKTAAI